MLNNDNNGRKQGLISTQEINTFNNQLQVANSDSLQIQTRLPKQAKWKTVQLLDNKTK